MNDFGNWIKATEEELPYKLLKAQWSAYWYDPENAGSIWVEYEPTMHRIVAKYSRGSTPLYVGAAYPSEDTDIEAAKEWLLLMTQAVCYGER